jgi:hypothetical protein
MDSAWSISTLVGTASRPGSRPSWACLIIALRIMAMPHLEPEGPPARPASPV